MIIKLLLITGFMILSFYALTQRRKTPAVSLVILLISAVGGIFVLFPDLATSLAHFTGVGRGVDLIIYAFILISLCAIFNLHLRIRANAAVMTELARAIAIHTVRSPEKKPSSFNLSLEHYRDETLAALRDLAQPEPSLSRGPRAISKKCSIPDPENLVR
jgi:hypothetical protein